MRTLRVESSSGSLFTFSQEGMALHSPVCVVENSFYMNVCTNIIYLEFAILRVDSTVNRIAKEQLDDLYDQSRW